MYNISISKKYIENPEYKKMLLVFLYLYQIEKRNGDIEFSINDIIDYWEYQRTNKKGEIPDTLRDCLISLQKENFIETDCDLSKLANAEKITIRFKRDLKNNYSWLKNKQFVILTDEELLKLKNCKKQYGVYVDKLVSLYLLIKSFMNFSDSVPNCYWYHERIMEMNKISKKTFMKMLDVLHNVGLLYNYKMYYTTNKKVVKYMQVYTTLNCDNNSQNLQLLKNSVSSKKIDFNDWYYIKN